MFSIHNWDKRQHTASLASGCVGFLLHELIFICSFFYRKGLTDDLGAEALMIDALDKVEKDLKKPLLRNDKKGMDLLLAEFDKINKK